MRSRLILEIMLNMICGHLIWKQEIIYLGLWGVNYFLGLKVTVLCGVNWFEFFPEWLNMIPWVLKDTKSVSMNDLVMLTELPWSWPCLGFSLNQNHLNITSWWYVVGQCLLADLAYRWHDSVKNWPQRWTSVMLLQKTSIVIVILSMLPNSSLRIAHIISLYLRYHILPFLKFQL